MNLPPMSTTIYFTPCEKGPTADPDLSDSAPANMSTGSRIQYTDAASGSKAIERSLPFIPACKNSKATLSYLMSGYMTDPTFGH